MPAPMRCLRPCDLPKLLSLWSSRLARRSPSLPPRCAGHRGLFVAPTLGFRLLYAFIIVRLARWRRHTHGDHWRNQEQSCCLTGSWRVYLSSTRQLARVGFRIAFRECPDDEQVAEDKDGA